MDKLPLYINIGLGVYFAVLLLFSILFGVKRGFGRAISRLVTIIISLPLAYFLCKLLLELVIDKLGLVDTIVESLSDEELTFTADTITPLMAVVTALCVPLLYIFVYFIVNKIMLIFYAISKKFIKKGQTKGSKLGGVIVSMLTCTISFCTLLLPLNGYVGVLSEASDEIVAMQDEPDSDMEEAFELFGDIRDTGLFKVTKGLSDGAFKLMTKTKLETTTGKEIKTDAKSELAGTLELVNDLADVMENEEASEDTVKSIAEVLDYKGKNSIDAIKITFTKMLKEAGAEWKAGNAYMSINLKTELNDDDVFNAFAPMLDKLANSNEDNISDILISLSNLIEAENNLSEYLTAVNSLSENADLKSVVDYIDEYNHETFDALLDLGNDQLSGVGGDSAKFITAFKALFDELYLAKNAGTYMNEISVGGYSLSLTTPIGIIVGEITEYKTTDVESVNYAIMKFYDYVKNKETYNSEYFANVDNMREFTLNLNELLDKILVSPALYNGVKRTSVLGIEFEVTVEEKEAIDMIIDSKKQQNGISTEQQGVLESLKNFFIKPV